MSLSFVKFSVHELFVNSEPSETEVEFVCCLLQKACRKHALGFNKVIEILIHAIELSGAIKYEHWSRPVGPILYSLCVANWAQLDLPGGPCTTSLIVT